MALPWGPLADAAERIAAQGARARATAGEGGLAHVITAQALFHLSMLVPMVLFYIFRLGDAAPRFPATISWTVRAGVPRYAQNSIWLCGWGYMGAFMAATGDGAMQVFAVLMVLTGVVGVMFCPVGVSPRVDTVHYIASFINMLDHFVLLAYLNMTPEYCLGFTLFLGVFIATTVQKGKMRKTLGVLVPTDAAVDTDAVYARLVARLGRDAQRKLFVVELMEMVYENLLFVVFISGMTSGL